MGWVRERRRVGGGNNACLFSARIAPRLFPEQPRLCVIVCGVFQVASGGESSCLGSQALQGVSLKRAEVWVITELIEPLFWAAPFFSGRHLRGLFAAEGAAAAKLSSGKEY